MKAILKSFEPKLKDGNQETWDSQHGLMYKFTLTFDDGSNAVAQSKSTDPSWKEGDEFDIVEKNGFKNAKKVQDNNYNGGNGGGGKQQFKPDPLKQQLIIAQSSCEKAIGIISDGVIQNLDEKGDFIPYTISDLKSLTGRIMTIVNELAYEHVKIDYNESKQ